MQWLQCQQLEQNRAERIDVRPGIDSSAGDLFWRHGDEGADDLTVLRCARRELSVCRCLAQLLVFAQHLGDSPIDQIDLAIRPEHDVGRLDIAVHHATVVGVVRSHGHLTECVEQLATGERYALAVAHGPKDLRKGLTSHALHGEERPVVARPHIVDGNDGWMFQTSLYSRLAEESSARRRVVARVFRHELQCDLASDLLVAHQLYGSHAASAEHALRVFVALRVAPADGLRPETARARADGLLERDSFVRTLAGRRVRQRWGVPEVVCVVPVHAANVAE
jgi:hypothetical protein